MPKPLASGNFIVWSTYTHEVLYSFLEQLLVKGYTPIYIYIYVDKCKFTLVSLRTNTLRKRLVRRIHTITRTETLLIIIMTFTNKFYFIEYVE